MPDSPTGTPSILEELRTSLEGLKRTNDGAMLFRMIERGLARYDTPGGRMEDAYIRFLYTLLDRFASDSTGNPVTRVKARLIQQRLAPHVDLEKIRERVKKSIRVPAPAPPPAPAPVTEQKKPEPEITNSKKIETDLIAAKSSLPRQKIEPEGDKTDSTFKTENTPLSADQENEKEKEETKPAQAGIDALEIPGELEDIKVESLESPESKLVPEISEPDLVPTDSVNIDEVSDELDSSLINTVAKNKEFNGLLKSNLKALELAENADDLMDLKQLLMRGLQELVQGQEVLDNDLAQAKQYMQEVKEDRKQLKVRVQKLAKRGVTDELTGLPKREMLIRQLEAEVGRARRYGFSLALSILDIDDLDQINQKYGRAAGDEVISCYVREVLANFRAYDFVARYGGDEFAILFPNTPKDGAYRALEKARKVAADTVINHDGKSIPLPGFSSVLTLYAQGEKPEVLLQRADEALSMAKLRGAGQILVSLPPPQ